MEETTRRRVCRVAFFLIVLAPCLGLLAVAGWRVSAWSDDAARRSIRDALGVDATWERLAYAAPGEIAFEQLQLLDPRSGALLATIDRLRIADASGQHRVAAGSILIESDAIPRLTRALETLDVDGLGDWQLASCEVQVVDAEGTAQAIATISKAESWAADGVRRLLFRFRPGRDQQADEIKLDIEMPRAGDTCRIALETGTTKLPLRMAAVVWPQFKAFGAQATYEGKLQLDVGGDTSHGMLHGEVDAIDLEQLVSRHTKQRLRGTGTLRVELARLVDGRLVEAQGSFGADEGTMGVAFLQDISAHLKIACEKAHADLARRDEDVEISEIQFDFQLVKDGLTLAGASAPGKALVRDAEGTPLLYGAQQKPVSPRWAVSALFPTSSPRLAAAHEALWLANWLPLPSAAELAALQPRPTTNENSPRPRDER